MKKLNLITALLVAGITAVGLLPVTASAASFKDEVTTQVRGETQRVHERRRDDERRYIERHREYRNPGFTRWAPSPRYRHDNGHHRGHEYRHRYAYPPVRHSHPPYYRDDVRLRILYDLYL